MKTEKQLQKGIKVLKERLKHQRSEVVQAQKRLGEPGYNKWYLARMRRNCQATENMLNGYKKALDKRSIQRRERVEKIFIKGGIL